VLRSIDLIAQFTAFETIALIAPRPLLMIVGTRAATAYLSQEAIEKAREPKELYWVDGATHVDLYDRKQYVPTALTKLTDFFANHLNAQRASSRKQPK
jgi:hypothetical protein